MKQTEDTPDASDSRVTVRLTPESAQKLKVKTKKLGISKSLLVELAIEAALDAIEANEDRLVLPLKFTTTHIAVSKPQAPTVIPGAETTLAGERSSRSSTAPDASDATLPGSSTSGSESDIGLVFDAKGKAPAIKKPVDYGQVIRGGKRKA